MNMMPNQDFANNLEATGLDKTNGSNPALARLMQAWESKQGKNAKKAGGLGLIAVSLSACGSDSDPAPTEPGGEEGQIFNLMIGDDNLTGSALADTFNALLASATGSLTGVLGLQTLGDTDIIDGGEGVDTLNAVLNGTGLAIFDLAAPFITDVEVYNLTARNDAGGLDLNNSTGYTQLWNINSSGDLTLVNVEEAAALGMSGTEGGTTYFVQYTSSAAADIIEQLVIASGVGGSTLSNQFTTLQVVDATAGDTGIEDLNLVVSNGVRLILEGSVANVQGLDIDGDGALVLSAEYDFPNLVSLDSTGYSEDLTLDVSGSTVLASVETAAGDDVITINPLAVDGGLSVDLGDGFDILELDGSFNSTGVTALDFTGGVAGVENLAFEGLVSLNGDAVLNLDGFDADLETVWFFEGLDGNGSELTLAESPVEDLRVNSTFIDWLDLDTGNVVNLEVNTSAGELDVDALAGDTLETIVLNQAGDGNLWLDVVGGVDNLNALTSIEANASNEDTYNTATVNIVDNSGSLTDGLEALESVSVTSDDDATLTMTGAESGIAAAQAAVDAAAMDVTDAQADVVAAEAAVDAAEAVEDAALVTQGVEQAELAAAQGVFDAAQAVVDAETADVAAAQAVVDAETADVAAAQDAVDAAQDALAAAQAEVAGFNAYLAAFDYDVDNGLLTQGAASEANRADLETYLLANSELNSDQTNALIDLIPGFNLLNPQFNSQAEFDNYLAAASAYLEGDYDIVGLTATLTAAQGVLATEQGELAAAQGVLATEQGELAAAEVVRDAAQVALDAAQGEFDAAVAAVGAAGAGVAAAEVLLAAAQQDLAEAQEALATAQANLAATSEDGTGFEALETVVVEAGEQANVELDDVYGAFTLDVTSGADATVSVVDTGVTTITIVVGDAVEYDDADAPTDFVFSGTDNAIVTLEDNADLETVTLTGARTITNITGDHSSMTAVDLTGISEQFTVDASGAEFAEGTNVFYLIGATSSEITNQNGDSSLTLGGGSVEEVREVVTFTEADFGTVVINNFAASSADPNETDRIDLSDLGFTNEGQLDFEVGSYGVDGVFTSGAGDDVRITDGSLADSASMGGEIIVTNIDTSLDGIESLQSNIVYL